MEARGKLVAMAAEESRKCGPGCHPREDFELGITAAEEWAREKKAFRLIKQLYEKEKADYMKEEGKKLPSDKNCMESYLSSAHDNMKNAQEAHKVAMDAFDPSTGYVACQCVSIGETRAYFCYIAFIKGVPAHQIRKDLECVSELVNEAMDAGKDQKRGLELIGIMQSQIDPA